MTPEAAVAEPCRPAGPTMPSLVRDPRAGITAYGCGPDEAVRFRAAAARLGAVPTITDAPLSAATVGLARGNRCVSVGHKTVVSKPTLAALRRVGVAYVSTRSVGVNHIDTAYAASLGIRVETVTYSSDSVADYTLMLILMAVRNAGVTLRRAAAHDFSLPDTCGRELRDLTVGVVGTGRIGSAVLDRLRGFGCELLAHDAVPTTSTTYVPLDELVRRSDIITLHTPLTEATHHLLDGRRITSMKSGAYVVNTGRGALLDTDALVTALERGDLGGAALDVLEGEDGVFYVDRRDQPIENHLLLRLERLPNVLISPHTAFYTDHALRDLVENSIANCLRFERGPGAPRG